MIRARLAPTALAAALATAACQGPIPREPLWREETAAAPATLAHDTRPIVQQGNHASAVLELTLDRPQILLAVGWRGAPHQVELQARLEPDSGEPRLLWDETFTPPAQPGEGWREHVVAVPPEFRSRRARLSLEAQASTGEVLLAQPVLAEPALPGGDSGPPNIILVSVDTLRADRLGCYGNPRPTSPNLDRLAREGLRFTRAYAPANWTLPSHYSLLSGLYPSAHGVAPDFHRVAGYRHPSEKLQMRGSGAERMLAERLAELGYLTAAITEDGWMYPRFGFDQGFASYVADTYGSLAATQQRTLEWLAAHRGTRFFLFVHTFQPHMPYDAPEPYASMFIEPDHIGILLPGVFVPVRYLELFADRTFPPMRADVEAFRAMYDSEVRYTDDFIGAVVAALREHDLAERTVLIVTGDHGEELFEHGGLGHGETLHEEVMRVPLIFWGPGRVPAGRVVEAPVSLVDVLPTVLRLVGADVGPPVQGRDLLQRTEGAASSSPRPVFAEAWAPGGVRTGAIWLGSDKYVVRESSPRQEMLFDLRQDPAEAHNSAADAQAVLDRFRRLWESFQRDSAAIREALGPVQTVPIPEVEERLRALGYVD